MKLFDTPTADRPATFYVKKAGLLPLCFGISLAICVSAARAQTTTAAQQKTEQLQFKDIEELSLEKLLDVTISIAAGRPQRVEDAPGIATVITDEEIRRLGARTLAEVLRFVPGYDVLTDNFGRRRIIVRGITGRSQGEPSESVLILFNGHRLNEDLFGSATTVNLDIPVDNIKRVEVIRGPGSALFGPNAFAGVINIISYTADDIQGFRVSTGGGSFSSQQYNVLAGHRFGDLALSGFVQFNDTRGPRLLVPADGQSNLDRLLSPFFPPASLAPGRTNDHRSAVDANFQLGYNGLTVNGRFKDEHSGGFIGPGESLGKGGIDTQQILLDVDYRHRLNDSGTLTGKFSFTQNRIEYLLNIAPPGSVLPRPSGGFTVYPEGRIAAYTTNSRRFAGEAILQYQLFKDHHFTLGSEFAYETTFGRETRANYNPFTLLPRPPLQKAVIDAFPASGRNLFSIYVQDIWRPLPRLEITGGVRYDYYSGTGDTVDPRIGFVWRFADGFHLKLLYGSAFRAPSILERTFNIPNGVFGNPNLKPSKLHSFEAALGYTMPNRFSLSANYFATFIRDSITLTVPVDSSGRPISGAVFSNEKGFDIHGVEIETRVNLWDHSLFANYTFQHAINNTFGQRATDVPLHLGSVGLTLSLGDYFKLTPSAIFRGSRARAPIDPRTDHPGYALFDLQLQARTPIPGLDVTGTINNLFDRKYTDPSLVFGVPGDYPRPGRSFFLKAIYKF